MGPRLDPLADHAAFRSMFFAHHRDRRRWRCHRHWAPVAAILLGGLGILAVAAIWAMIGRNWRSWGYTEREDDLLVVRGALFKKLVVVPYGRMQLVDLEAGPLQRVFGIVTVKLHTAAATTDARIRGLLPKDAAALRDRLSALGEAHLAGL